MKILVIDNYDSFVYNIAQILGELGAEPIVVRNNQITLEDIEAMNPDGIVISPGPGHPADRRYFGVCTTSLQSLDQRRQYLASA